MRLTRKREEFLKYIGNFWWVIVGSGSGSGALDWMNEIENFG